MFFQWRERRAPAFVGLRELLAELRLNRDEILPRLLDRDAGLQPADRRVEAGRAHREQSCGGLRRDPDFCRPRGMSERRRHDADDRVADAAEHERAADRRRIGREPSLPEHVAQHHEARSAEGFFQWTRCSSDRGRDAYH